MVPWILLDNLIFRDCSGYVSYGYEKKGNESDIDREL